MATHPSHLGGFLKTEMLETANSSEFLTWDLASVFFKGNNLPRWILLLAFSR